MAERTSDLEIHRSIFVHELTKAQPDLSNYQDFLRYWKSVESDAMHTEDLGQLDEWVRDLARDKERLVGLRNRADTMGDKDGALQTLVQILKLVLDIIEGIYRRLRRLRDERLSILAAMLWKGGPGTIAKPKPDKEDKKEKRAAGEATAASEPVVPAHAIKPPEAKRDKDKKMER